MLITLLTHFCHCRERLDFVTKFQKLHFFTCEFSCWQIISNFRKKRLHSLCRFNNEKSKPVGRLNSLNM